MDLLVKDDGMVRARAILVSLALLSPSIGVTRAEGPAERVALAGDAAAQRDQPPFRRPTANAHVRGGKSSGGWWFSTAGIVAVLAVLGGGSLAAKRWKLVPGRETAALEIVGRTFLTSRQAVYLVRAGGRTLLIGTGPQGAPSLLGELPREAESQNAPGGMR
jgi:flagellar biogenesis protein FliO